MNMTANSLYPGTIVTNLFRHSNIVTGNYFTFLVYVLRVQVHIWIKVELFFFDPKNASSTF